MNEIIAKSYYRLIKAGTRTYANIPETMKPLVKSLADAELAAGTITLEQYNSYLGIVTSEDGGAAVGGNVE